MARSNTKHHRAYMDGYDISGYARALPSIAWMFEAVPESALSDGVKNIALGRADLDVGALNVMLDNDAAGAFALASSGSGEKNVAFAIGTNAAPVAGDPVFAWKLKQAGYAGEQGSGFVMANVGFGGASSEGVLTYSKPWGVCLHPFGAATGANTAVGIDDVGAASTAGGIFVYHLFSSNGTVTLTAQEASTNSNGSFANITSATSGSITASVSPKHGFVELGTTAAIKRYLRWQLSFGTASTATFFAAFIRG